MGLVEEHKKQEKAQRHELGGRNCFCTRCRIFHKQLFFPELRHSLVFVGKEPTHRRLSSRQQDELRSEKAHDTAFNAFGCKRIAYNGHEELYRVAAMGI